MHADIERWDAKYRAAHPNPDFTPDPLLVRHADLLHGGLALDVACGPAHNAIFLAARGYEVIAVDGSLVGLGYARERLREHPLPVHLVAADLDRFAPPPGRFDLIVVVRYLDRALLARLLTGLAPDGLLIVKTFNVNYAKDRPAFRPEYLLGLGELRRLLGKLDVIATNDAPALADSETYYIGRRTR